MGKISKEILEKKREANVNTRNRLLVVAFLTIIWISVIALIYVLVTPNSKTPSVTGFSEQVPALVKMG